MDVFLLICTHILACLIKKIVFYCLNQWWVAIPCFLSTHECVFTYLRRISIRIKYFFMKNDPNRGFGLMLSTAIWKMVVVQSCPWVAIGKIHEQNHESFTKLMSSRLHSLNSWVNHLQNAFASDQNDFQWA